MRKILFGVSAMVVLFLVFWAYRENYRTQAEFNELRALQTEIGQMRESLGVLNAEWAYLNRPDRLRELADLNFQRLQLMPLTPEQFGTVTQVQYPSILDAAVSADPAAPADPAPAAVDTAAADDAEAAPFDADAAAESLSAAQLAQIVADQETSP